MKEEPSDSDLPDNIVCLEKYKARKKAEHHLDKIENLSENVQILYEHYTDVLFMIRIQLAYLSQGLDADVSPELFKKSIEEVTEGLVNSGSKEDALLLQIYVNELEASISSYTKSTKKLRKDFLHLIQRLVELRDAFEHIMQA
jgi:hypothetical protein